jgi:hypothetical protein
MSGYKPSHWSAAYFNDPIERSQAAETNYYPHNRYSPYIDPNFNQPNYHQADMPYMHGTPCGGNCNKAPVIPPAMSGYSSWIISLFK